jgi:hypothetical protein
MAEDEPLAPEANAALSAAHVQAALTYVSPISAWEVGLLAARERLQLLITPQRWFARILDLPNVLLADMSPDFVDCLFIPARQAAARSRRPYHPRYRARSRRDADHARPRFDRLC